MTSATLTWSGNTNPGWTHAELQRSTYSDFSTRSDMSAGTYLFYTDANLDVCTTYYFQVRNRNGNGVPTAYDNTLQFVTMGSTPAAPGELSAVPQPGRKIALAWNKSPSLGITQYRLYYDAGSGAVNYASPLAVLTSTETGYATGVLASSASYTFALRAMNRCAVEEKNTSALASAAALDALSSMRAAIKVPNPGKRVKGNRVTVMAELLAGDPSRTSVLFQYKATTASAWAALPAANIEHPNPDPAPPFAVHWDVTSLTTATYDLRAVAAEVSGSSDTAPASVTITVIASADPDYQISEWETFVDGKWVVKKQQALPNTLSNTIQTMDNAKGQVAKVVLPAGSLDSSETVVSVIVNPTLPLPASSSLAEVGSAVEITLANGQTNLAGGQRAALTLSYPDLDDNDIVDGTKIKASELKIYSLNGAAWTDDLVSALDTTNHTLTAETPHFSFFAVFGAQPAADLTTVRVYPNPFKPNGGIPNEGKPFNPTDPDSGIVFENLTGAVSIKIYTVDGRLVAQMESKVSTGKIQWDARNDGGRDAASGVYFAVITSPELKTRVEKIVIIR